MYIWTVTVGELCHDFVPTQRGQWTHIVSLCVSMLPEQDFLYVENIVSHGKNELTSARDPGCNSSTYTVILTDTNSPENETMLAQSRHQHLYCWYRTAHYQVR